MNLSTSQKTALTIKALKEMPGAMTADQFLTNHYISSSGLYVRELLIPAGTLVVGRAKNKEYVTLLTAGTVEMRELDGAKLISAPFTTLSKPGEERLIYAVTDAVLTTAHAVTSTTLDEIEREVVGG